MAGKNPHERWKAQSNPEEALARRDSLIDEQIRNAQERGEFEDLPGYGKPLPWDPAQDIAAGQWMSNRILKQAGFVPEWVTLRKEIAVERPAVNDALSTYRSLTRSRESNDPASNAELDRLEQRYIKLATAINKKIDEHNGQCPASQALTRFVEDATRRW